MRRVAVAATLLVAAACERFAGAKTAFRGEDALGHVRTQMTFGPRVPGTAGHRRAGDWIVEQMRARADTVYVQEWTHVTAAGDSLPMRNVIARFRPDVAERVLYVTHWDTRPISDGRNTPPAQRQTPVPGANDGGSGVALFIALGDALKRTPPSVGVDLVFVDGEDYGNFDTNTDVLIGSKYFARNLPAPGYRPLFGVVWDMIGDRDLQIYQEGHSVRRAPEVVSRVWQVAGDLGYDRSFLPQQGQAITDDHLPLLDVGLRVIDVIDIDFPSHHTPEDTVDKVSAKSLQTVGDVALALVMGR